MIIFLKRFIKMLISTVYFIFDWTLYSLSRIIFRGNRGRIVILYYHSIKDHEKDKFIRQMNLTAAKTVPVPLNILINHADGKKPFSPYSSITFDDGFTSVIKNALPAMELRNISAAVFIPAKCLGKNPGWLNETDLSDKNEIIISKKQLAALSKNSLITIGSHGLYHKNLISESAESARMEIEDSSKELKKLINNEIDFISFPHGDYTGEHLKISRNTGYKRAFGIFPETANINTEKFIIGRTEVNPSDWGIEFYLKLMGAYNWFGIFMRIKKKILNLSINR